MADQIKTIVAEIVGISGLLQHRFSEAAQSGDTTRPAKLEDMTPRDQAESVVYRNNDGFYFPGSWIARTLREAGASHKQKSTRKSLKYIVPAAVIVLDDHIPLLNEARKARLHDYEVDSRPVTIPATKGRIMRHRPRFDAWGARFNVQVDEEVLDAAMIHQLLTESGKRIGLGDYRPECGGPFGRFRVVSWKEPARRGRPKTKAA